MNTDKKDLLYQDIPSIKNRISRNERVSLRRRKICTDCQPDHITIAKQKSKHLYYFYLAILAIGIITLQIQKRQNNTESFAKESSKTIRISFTKKITATIIDQKYRYGISIVFRNTGNQIWNINTLKLDIPNLPDQKEIIINYSLAQDDFHSVFIPLTEKINKIDDITITTTS